MVAEAAYAIKSNGNLAITNSKKFLEMLSGVEDKDHYEKLVTFGKKHLNMRAQDIPFNDQLMVINWAIMKTMQGFDPDAGANLLTYYTDKLRGEISDYRSKRESLTGKIHKLATSEGGYVKTFNGENEEAQLEKITEDTAETIMLAEDVYRRKMQAFRMAFSGIPLYSQHILNILVSNKYKIQEIAEIERISTTEIQKIRNYALSLILARVLRSNHLDDDEKDEIRKEHGLIG